MYCTNCGNRIDDNAYICIHCGVKVEQSAPKAANANPTVYCTNCGKQIDSRAYICVHCGVKTNFNNETSPKNRNYSLLAIFSMVLTFITVRIIGAVLAIVGLTLSILRHDQKAIKLNLVAVVFSVIISIVTILIYL